MFLICSYLPEPYPNAARLLAAISSSALLWWRLLHKTGLMMSSFIGARSIVIRHVWGSRLPGRTAGVLTSLGNRLTRQAGKLVRALQAGAQAIGIVWNNRHGRLFSRLRITAGLVFLAQLFAQAPLRTQAEDGTMI